MQLVDERGEVVGRVGDLGRLPTEEALDLRLLAVVRGREDGAPGDRPVRRCRRETPQRQVLEGALPAGEQTRGHAPHRGGPVELGEATRPVGLRLVDRHSGLLEDASVEVVQLGEGAPQTGGERGARGDRGQLDPTAGEVGADGAAAPFGQRDPALDGRDGHGQATAQQGQQRGRLLEAGGGRGRARAADDPAAVLVVLDEGDVVGTRGSGPDDPLDGGRVEAGHGSAGQGGESQRSTRGHPPTVRGAGRRTGEQRPSPTDPARSRGPP